MIDHLKSLGLNNFYFLYEKVMIPINFYFQHIVDLIIVYFMFEISCFVDKTTIKSKLCVLVLEVVSDSIEIRPFPVFFLV